jgi:hypothetical protein
MRKLLFCILTALITFNVYADESQSTKDEDRLTNCIYQGSTYEIAARLRDADMDPKEVLERIKYAYPVLTDSFIKTAINNVYFDKDFAYAGGQALAEQMQNLCMYGPKHYKPLK